MPRDAVFVVPGRLDARTGGSIYDRRMVEGLRSAGWHIEVREVPGRFPLPSSDALEEVADAFARIPRGSIVLADGLVFNAIPDIAERESVRLHLVALVHLPLAADVTRDRDAAKKLEEGERRALRAADMVIATGRVTLSWLAGFGLPEVIVVEPGTDRAPLARGSGGRRVKLLTVGAIHAGKGHELLLEALASLPHRNWHLTIAGSLTREPHTVGVLRDVMKRSNLESLVTIAGELNDAELSECYDGADVFVLATLQETYGMAVAEALARGLPIISTLTGAIPDLVGADAGILVPPGDGAALAAALDRVLREQGADLRARLARGARLVRERLRTWDDAAREMVAALSRIPTNG